MSQIVGIDLGASGATVATIKKGSIEVVLNEASKRKSPALVSFHNGQRYLGEPASSLESSNAKNTVRELKRLVGKNWSDPEVQRDIARMPNRDRFKELPNDLIGIEVSHNDQTMVFDPTALLAMQLGGLKRTSERTLKEATGTPASVRDVVLSVPTYYTDAQRRAVLDAAKISGLNVLSLANDAAAVALDYGMWKNARNQFDESKRTLVMFVDVGYADSWVSVVSYTKGKLAVLSCVWDRELGGRDVDSALMEQFAAEFQAKTKLDARKDIKAMIKLRSAAEKAKQVLTPEGMNKAEVFCEYLLNETDLKTHLTIEQLDAVVKPLADRLGPMVQKALDQANIKAADLNSAEIIGGSSRMRQFKKAVGNALGLDTSKPPNFGVLTTLNGDESVARGCALMCAMLSPQLKITSKLIVEEFVTLPIKLQWDALPNANGKDAAPAAPAADNMDTDEGQDVAAAPVAAGQGTVQLLNKTDVTPKIRRVTFRRSEAFDVHAVYDDAAEALLPAKTKREFAKFRISGMPANAAGKGKIAVDFEHDRFGVFGVKGAQFVVTEEKPGEDGKKKITKSDLQVLSTNASLKESDFEKYLQVENELTMKDKLLKDRADKRNEFEEFIYSARSALEGNLAQYATEEERAGLMKKLEEDEAWMYSDEGEEATLQQLTARLGALHTPYDVVQNRLLEIEARSNSVNKFSNLIQQYVGVSNSVSPDYEHISDDERNKVRAACAEAEKWLGAQLEAQGKLPLNKDPILTASAIDEKAGKLRQECRPIVEKPKPKPPKTDPPGSTPPPPNTPPPAGTPPSGADGGGAGANSTNNENGKDEQKAPSETNGEKMDVEELD